MRVLSILVSLRRLAGWLALAGIGGCGQPAADESADRRQDSIYGGELSPPDQDAVVAISGSSRGWGAGVVVAPTLVLTARQGVVALAQKGQTLRCGDGLAGVAIDQVDDPLDLSIGIGNSYPFGKDAWFAVKHVFSSSSLDLCTDGVALLQVDRPMPIAPLPLRLATDGPEPPPKKGDAGFLVGWGQTEEALVGTGTTSRIYGKRRQLELVIGELGPGYLSVGEEGSIRVPKSFFAAESIEGKGACFNDTGGPFISANSRAVIGLFNNIEEADETRIDEAQPVDVCAGSHAMFRMLWAPEYDWLEEAFARAGEAPWYEGWSRPAGAGQPCQVDQECSTGRCLHAQAASFCSQPCSAADCPSGMQCVGPAADAWCVPARVDVDPSTVKGCSTAPPTKSKSAALILGLVALAGLLRRGRGARLSHASGDT